MDGGGKARVVGAIDSVSSLKIINIAILTNAPRCFTNCPSRLQPHFPPSSLQNQYGRHATSSNYRRDIFKCTASPSHPGRILPTRHDIAYSFPHRTFAITLREPMTRMENEIVRRIEISLFYLHPCLERTADFNADFS